MRINSTNNINLDYNNSNFLNNDYNKINAYPKKEHKMKKVKKTNKKFIKRPYDWICNRCNNINFAFRNVCNICELPLKDNSLYKSEIQTHSKGNL